MSLLTLILSAVLAAALPESLRPSVAAAFAGEGFLQARPSQQAGPLPLEPRAASLPESLRPSVAAVPGAAAAPPLRPDAPCGPAADSAKFAKFDSLLTEFHAALLHDDFDTKAEQMDFLVGACHDSLLRQHVALSIYDYYKESPVMGDEAVAIHMYDRWFADGSVAMRSELDRIDARMFADFNRSSLLGMQAPRIELYDRKSRAVGIPTEGRTCLIFFYDTSCGKCRMDIKLLPRVLEGVDFPLDLIMVYCGQERKPWRELARTFKAGNRNVLVVHLWDPKFESDYIRKYGVIGTPKIFMVEPGGTVIGRRLEMDNVLELIPIASALQSIE